MLDTASIEADEEGDGASPDGDVEEAGRGSDAASDFFIVGIGASAGGLEKAMRRAR